jgi:hypothetical protein
MEVEQELVESDQILGNEKDVERFVLSACERLNASLIKKKNGFLLQTPPQPLTATLGNKPRTIAFTTPVSEGVEYVGRNHPLVEGLARHSLEEALEVNNPTAARCGFTVTDAVERRTTLLLLRLRHLLESPKHHLLAEECLVAGFTGSPSDPLWLSSEQAMELLQKAEPVDDLPLFRKRLEVDELLSRIGELEEELQQIALGRWLRRRFAYACSFSIPSSSPGNYQGRTDSGQSSIADGYFRRLYHAARTAEDVEMSVVVGTLAVQIEGNLLTPDMPAELLTGSIKGQAPEDFGFFKTDKLADEIATAWGDAKVYWAALQRALTRLDENDPATSVTREQWVVPLLRSLRYDPVYTAKAEVVEGQTYAISHRAEPGENKPPIHIVGCRVKLEQRPPSGTPRLSAHALIQEYLNRTEHLWGIVTNGLRWRLLRDSSLMTRLTYMEFDLEQILNGENFAEFGLFYRLFHRSRLPKAIEDTDDCLLEHYHQEAIQQGGRVRDRLRDGVEKALVQLGTGFVQHSHNQELRRRFESGELTDTAYYRQLLRLIYRLLFLMVTESRNLLLTESDAEKARIYQEYYSIGRLRDLAEVPVGVMLVFKTSGKGYG